jgi:hypothetical protein
MSRKTKVHKSFRHDLDTGAIYVPRCRMNDLSMANQRLTQDVSWLTVTCKHCLTFQAAQEAVQKAKEGLKALETVSQLSKIPIVEGEIIMSKALKERLEGEAHV